MRLRWTLLAIIAAFSFGAGLARIPPRAVMIADPAGAFALGAAVDVCGSARIDAHAVDPSDWHPHESCLGYLIHQHKLPDGRVLPRDAEPFLPIARELDKITAPATGPSAQDGL